MVCILFVSRCSDRKMDLRLLMTKSKDGGMMWCGTSGKVIENEIPSPSFLSFLLSSFLPLPLPRLPSFLSFFFSFILPFLLSYISFALPSVLPDCLPSYCPCFLPPSLHSFLFACLPACRDIDFVFSTTCCRASVLLSQEPVWICN